MPNTRMEWGLAVSAERWVGRDVASWRIAFLIAEVDEEDVVERQFSDSPGVDRCGPFARDFHGRGGKAGR